MRLGDRRERTMKKRKPRKKPVKWPYSLDPSWNIAP